MFNEACLIYCLKDEEEKTVKFKNLACRKPELQIQLEKEQTEFGTLLYLKLRAATRMELVDFQLEARPLGIDKNSLMMVNGFQSWSSSREMMSDERIKPVFPLSRFATEPYGDYGIYKYPNRRGRLHSWTYTYFRNLSDPFYLFGSVDESSGYTLFDYDFNTGMLVISRDCRGVILHEGDCFALLSLYLGKGDEKELFEDYFARWSLLRKGAPQCTGWTSWYNYYTNISADIIDENLEVLRRGNIAVDVFQIDDGYQKAVGDWLEVNDKFPAGMGAVAGNIRRHGLKPGLWLAPFICEHDSRLFKIKPEWLLRDARGKPVRAGWNPMWSGYFYALDFYADGFRDYLREVFRTVGEEWGFELLKLDFLYGVAILPHHGRSRGQIMSEAMDFIHDIAGRCRLLGCGVPLGPAMGKVDYCRIGSDVAPFWEYRLLKFINVRERISTINSLSNTIGRARLDGYAFRNDPDVFILRDGKIGVNRNKLSGHQRFTLFFVNHLLGGLVFLSDNIGEYNVEQMNMLRQAYPVKEKEIIDIIPSGDLYRIRFKVNGDEYLALVNLGSKACRVKPGHGIYFNPDRCVIYGDTEVRLSPYESLCLRKVEPSEGKPYLLGASGHIYPGAQIAEVKMEKDGVTLRLAPGAAEETRVFFSVPSGDTALCVNGIDYQACLYGDLYYVVVKPEAKEERLQEQVKEKKELPPSLPYRKPERPRVRKLYRKDRGD